MIKCDEMIKMIKNDKGLLFKNGCILSLLSFNGSVFIYLFTFLFVSLDDMYLVGLIYEDLIR